MGSKNRHSKELLPIILKSRAEGQWYVEPFVGGANMIDKVDGNRIGSDSHRFLIALLIHVQNNSDMPDFIPEDKYANIRLQINSNVFIDPDWLIGFIGFCCSFGGKWMGGYARGQAGNNNSRNYCGESKRNLLKQAPNLCGIKFYNENYLNLTIPEGSIIYNDPPYFGTTSYKDNFNHDIFWDWVRHKSLSGHTVFTSEYTAPGDFISIWSKETIANFSLQNNIDKSRIEKLFIHESQFDKFSEAQND